MVTVSHQVPSKPIARSSASNSTKHQAASGRNDTCCSCKKSARRHGLGQWMHRIGVEVAEETREKTGLTRVTRGKFLLAAKLSMSNSSEITSDMTCAIAIVYGGPGLLTFRSVSVKMRQVSIARRSTFTSHFLAAASCPLRQCKAVDSQPAGSPHTC